MSRIFLPLLILSLIACCIEIDISVPSFPDMAHYFGVDEGVIQMTVAYNFFGFCLGAAAYGPLSDGYGRRPIMVFGNGLLLIGAMGCVVAPSISWLLASRFIQGIGASTSAVVVFAMIADAYPNQNKAAQLIGLMNALLSALIAIAPVAGGFINEAIGWRGNYGSVAIVSLISWVLLFFFLPETKKDRLKFNLLRTVWDYKTLLTNIAFIGTALVPSLLYAGYLSFVTQASFLYTETFGLSIIAYALHQGVIVFSFSFVSLLSGRITRKTGARNSVMLGMALCGFSSVALVSLSLVEPQSPYLMTFVMSLFCMGIAICYPVIFAESLEIFPLIKGTASSAIMSMRALVCAICAGLTGYLYNGQPIRISVILLSIMAIGVAFTVNMMRLDQFAETT